MRAVPESGNPKEAGRQSHIFFGNDPLDSGVVSIEAGKNAIIIHNRVDRSNALGRRLDVIEVSSVTPQLKSQPCQAKQNAADAGRRSHAKCLAYTSLQFWPLTSAQLQESVLK